MSYPYIVGKEKNNNNLPKADSKRIAEAINHTESIKSSPTCDFGYVIMNQEQKVYNGFGTQFDLLRHGKIYHDMNYVNQAIEKIKKSNIDAILSIKKVKIEVID